MKPSVQDLYPWSPAALCRMGAPLRQTIAKDRPAPCFLLSISLTTLVGSMIYGVVLGLWRSKEQALYSAIKMPLLIFSVVMASTVINTMLANSMGARVSFRQVSESVLLAFAVTCSLLAALSPVMLFFVLQTPSPGTPEARLSYPTLLLAHTAVIGFAGIWGNVRLYELLKNTLASPNIARRLLVTWIVVSGLAGCEISWVLSPFLAKPDIPIPFLNPDAFSGNFFEYLWRAIRALPQGGAL